MFVLVLTALDRTIHVTPIDLFSPQHICLLLIYLPLPFPTAAFPTLHHPHPRICHITACNSYGASAHSVQLLVFTHSKPVAQVI